MIEKIKQDLEKKHYRLFNHSGVQICEWTKKSVREEDVCYKEKFYGIDCHRCMQFSPAVSHCNLNCIFCWRPNELMYRKILEKLNEPKEIIDALTELRKQLLSGFGGSAPNKEKLKEAFEPNHFAISLSGEPTLYSKLPQLIEYLSDKAKSIFLVTNGTNPEVLEKIHPKRNFQLYISLNAPTREKFLEICKPVDEKEWNKFKDSLEIMRTFKGRTVLRLTLIKGVNSGEKFIQDYLKLISKASPDFLEIKAFMSIGNAKKRLGDEAMPDFEEIKEYAGKIEDGSNYNIENLKESSRIVLLKHQNSKASSKFT